MIKVWNVAKRREVLVLIASEASIGEDRKGSELCRVGDEINRLYGLIERISIRH